MAPIAVRDLRAGRGRARASASRSHADPPRPFVTRVFIALDLGRCAGEPAPVIGEEVRRALKYPGQCRPLPALPFPPVAAPLRGRL